jgi:hypothetical protein
MAVDEGGLDEGVSDVGRLCSAQNAGILQHDSDRTEDLDTTQEDHAADDWRYACNSRPWVKPTPKKPGQMPIIKPRWPTFKELTDEHDRRMKMKGRRI